MHYTLKPDPKRPLSTLITGPADDARWRKIPNDVSRIDRVRAHEIRQANRPRWLEICQPQS